MMTNRFCSLCMKHSFRKLDANVKRLLSSSTKITNAEARRRRNALFEEEKARQLSFIKRLEKIEVSYQGQPENATLLMNKDLSTPYNCAMHINEFLMKRSMVAVVNGEAWDMHRPLTGDCTLEFRHALDEDTRLPNEAFWRTGSFVLGHILETSFKDDVYVELCSFPKPHIESGSFVYDVDLKLPDWSPTPMEMTSLGITGGRLYTKNLEFERLEVDASLALDMFRDNRFKVEQIPDVAESHSTQNKVTLYRMGDHVDICKGPLIGSTGQIGRFSVTAVHPIESSTYGSLQRVQGLAMPSDIRIHWWTYDFLAKRAAHMNNARIPEKSARKPLNISEELDTIPKVSSNMH